MTIEELAGEGWDTRTALSFCQRKYKALTEVALINMIKKYSLGYKKDGYHWYIRSNLLISHINRTKSQSRKPLPGWITVDKAVRESKLSRFSIYRVIHKYKIPIRMFGEGRGIIHVSRKKLRSCIEKYTTHN